MTGPYAQAATHYYDAGWPGVLPIAHKNKHGEYVDQPGKSWPPGGYTGGPGAYPTREQVAAWIAAKGHLNLGLRLPRGKDFEIIGIDHDAYKAADTFDNLCQIEAQWLGPDGAKGTGSPPATLMSTARTDGESCIRFYKVPPGLDWHDPGEGVEIIRPAHRFAVVWPSVHPETGSQYAWYLGERPAPAAKLDRIPSVDEIPRLPESWVATLTGPARGATRGTQAGRRAGPGSDTWSGDPVDSEAILRGELAGYPNERRALIGLAAHLWAKSVALSAVKAVCWQAAEAYNAGPAVAEGGRHDPAKPWTREEVDHMVADWTSRYEPGSSGGVQVGPGHLAWLGGSTGGDATGTPPDITDSIAAERLRIRVRRIAQQEEDEREAAEARGERPKRTAREFAQVPKPPVVLADQLAVGPNGIAGPQEAGKSLRVRDWLLEIAASGRTVLAVLSEGTHDFEERWAVHPLWELAADRVYVIDAPVDLVRGSDVEWLLAEYAEERPVAVAFDIIYDMGMSDDNGFKDVIPVFRSLKRISKEWDAATIAVGHPGHNGERRFRGSSMWRQLFVTDWFMADGAVTCEKSKIADKRRLARNYRVEYPHLQWLTSGEAVVDEARRRLMIEGDFTAYPRDTDANRARRLHPVLGLGDRATRQRIAQVRNEREDA